MQRLTRASLLTPALLALLFVANGKVFGQEFDPSIFYQIKAKHSGRCLDVSGGTDATGNGVQVIQWDCHDGDNQKWQIVPVADGFYKILAKHSGKALDVFGGIISTGDGVTVQQRDFNGLANQLWMFSRQDDGSYKIVVRHSGKSLEIGGGPTATWNGATAQQWVDVSGPNQRWWVTPLPGAGTAGVDVVSGTFSYTDAEADPRGSGTFNRPVAGCLVQVWRAGGLATTTETDAAGKFNVPVPHTPDGTDTTVLVYATNAAAQVLAGSGPFFVQSTQVSRGNTPLDFSANFINADQVRSFNAAHDIRLAFNYASARRDPSESEPIPKVDVTFMDHDGAGTRYNQPAAGLLIHRINAGTDLVIMHEYAHFLEDKIGSFLFVASYHDTCSTTQRCPNPAECLNLTGTTNTMLVNSPEHAWMEGFASYFAMAVKRANPAERLNITTLGNTMTEAELDNPAACEAVGRTAFDGRVINGEMIERFVAGALWSISRGGDAARSEEAVFQIFDRELDESATHMLPTISKFREAWIRRQSMQPALLNRAALDDILRVNIPTVVRP
jgi:hypothetical protein